MYLQRWGNCLILKRTGQALTVEDANNEGTEGQVSHKYRGLVLRTVRSYKRELLEWLGNRK